MKKLIVSQTFLVMGLALAAGAQTAPNKVGVIHIQNAIVSTRDGQKASADLSARYEPKRKEIEQKQNEINGLQDQLKRGSNTLSEEAKQSLMRDVDQRTRSFNRVTEDAQSDFEQDRNRLLQELGQRLMIVIQKYAQDNGYSLIIDISAPETPVLWAATAIDITNDIVGLYDKNAPPPAQAPAPAAPKAVSPLKPAPAKK